MDARFLEMDQVRDSGYCNFGLVTERNGKLDHGKLSF